MTYAQWLCYFGSKGWRIVEKGDKFDFSSWPMTFDQE